MQRVLTLAWEHPPVWIIAWHLDAHVLAQELDQPLGRRRQCGDCRTSAAGSPPASAIDDVAPVGRLRISLRMKSMSETFNAGSFTQPQPAEGAQPDERRELLGARFAQKRADLASLGDGQPVIVCTFWLA